MIRPAKIDTPYLTSREAAEYLKLGSVDALLRLVTQHRLPACRRGRLYLFDRREIDVWLHGHDSELAMLRAVRRRA